MLNLDLENELPFTKESFDLIISSLVIYYINDWSKTFSEFQRILKPGGKLLFSIHHPFMDFKLSKNKQYFSTELIIDQWEREGRSIEVPFYRRSLSEVLNKTLEYFSIDCIIEPQPTIKFKLLDPLKYERLMSKPHFLIMKGSKKKKDVELPGSIPI